MGRTSKFYLFLIILIFFLFLYVRTTNKASKIFKLTLITTIIIVGISIFITYADSTFSFFLSRLDNDTRSSVEYYFFQSFKGETIDWIIGRGINGTYYCPIFDNSNRDMIETGYLHLILKGGIIYLTLYIILLAHSAYIGFFRTTNILTKAMALYLVAHILYLIPWGLPSFSFEYIIVWVCIYYCQSKKWRLYPDLEIRNYLSFKKIP